MGVGIAPMIVIIAHALDLAASLGKSRVEFPPRLFAGMNSIDWENAISATAQGRHHLEKGCLIVLHVTGRLRVEDHDVTEIMGWLQARLNDLRAHRPGTHGITRMDIALFVGKPHPNEPAFDIDRTFAVEIHTEGGCRMANPFPIPGDRGGDHAVPMMLRFIGLEPDKVVKHGEHGGKITKLPRRLPPKTAHLNRFGMIDIEEKCKMCQTLGKVLFLEIELCLKP